MNKEQLNDAAEIKKPSERTNEDLLELVCQLSGRFAMHQTKELFDAYWEARNEMNKRIAAIHPQPTDEAIALMAEKIYVASKTKHAYKWRALRDDGYNIISTWIDEAGEGESSDLFDLQQRCINESKKCDLMIVYREKDDYLKGAFIEMGIALSLNKPIYLIGEVLPIGSAFTYNKSIHQKATFENCIDHYRTIAPTLSALNNMSVGLDEK